MTDEERADHAHAINDIETECAGYRRMNNEMIDFVLDTALVALRNGATDVADEYLDRALRAMRARRADSAARRAAYRASFPETTPA